MTRARCILIVASVAQFTGNLFIQLAGDDMFEHFPLARCERVETRADSGKLGLFPPGDSVSFNRGVNGRKQIFSIDGFGEEIKLAMFHCLHALRNITVTGEKNNRQATAFLAECCLELKAIEARHREIKHETPRHPWKYLARNSLGDAKAATAMPAERSKRETAFRTAASSSTTNTMGLGRRH